MRIFSIASLAFGAAAVGFSLASDAGSHADVAAVRAAAHRKNPTLQTNAVHVVGNYALIQWFGGEAAGFALFKRSSGERWQQTYFSGGATNVSDLSQHGVPAATARKLCSGWGASTPC